MTGADEIDALVVESGAAQRILHRIVAEEDDVARRWLDTGPLEDARQLNARPLGNAAPAFDAIVPRDLGTRRHGAQIIQAERQRLVDKPCDLKLVPGEIVLLDREIVGGLRIGRAVRSLAFANGTLRVFARHRRRSLNRALRF